MLSLIVVLFVSFFAALMVDGYSRVESVARGDAISEGWGLSTLLGFGTFALMVGGYLAFRILI